MTNQHARKTLIVNRSLQYKIMAYMTGIASMSSLVTVIIAQFIADFRDDYSPLVLIAMTFIISLILIAVWMGMMLLFSNRIFGPIYRLHREIRNWKNGDPVQPIKLRKGDHLTELIDDFNELAAKSAR